MPIVRPIYKTVKQIFETLFSKSGSSFRKVGLVEFPSPGMWSLVFLSQSPSAEIAARLPATEHVSAFLPCTPNPTTGFFFYVPRRDVIELDITVEAAMTLLMSAGMIQPGGDDAQKRLAALAETARAAQPCVTPATTCREISRRAFPNDLLSSLGKQRPGGCHEFRSKRSSPAFRTTSHSRAVRAGRNTGSGSCSR